MTMMTTEIALARLSRDTFDSIALEQLYTLNSREVRNTIEQWFGHDSIFDYALSWAMAGVAAHATQFRPEHQTPEAFVVEIVNAECKRVHDVLARTRGSLS
jgi:hypothetical protein